MNCEDKQLARARGQDRRSPATQPKQLPELHASTRRRTLDSATEYRGGCWCRSRRSSPANVVYEFIDAGVPELVEAAFAAALPGFEVEQSGSLRIQRVQRFLNQLRLAPKMPALISARARSSSSGLSILIVIAPHLSPSPQSRLFQSAQVLVQSVVQSAEEQQIESVASPPNLRKLQRDDIIRPVFRTTATGGYPPRMRTKFITSRAVRPLPSLNG